MSRIKENDRALACCDCGGEAQGNYGCTCTWCGGGGHRCNDCFEDEKGVLVTALETALGDLTAWAEAIKHTLGPTNRRELAAQIAAAREALSKAGGQINEQL